MWPIPNSQNLLLSVLVIYFFPFPTSATSLTTWIHTASYTNGSLVEEIQCYSLPFGAIGFISHLLTYYTIIILSLQRYPWCPFLRNTHSRFDIILALLGIILSVIISSLAIVRCRGRWQFIAMAVWKLDLSITYGLLSFHAALVVPRGDEYWDPEKSRDVKVLLWLLLYIPGIFVGLAGLFSLVAETIQSNPKVLLITAVFGSITLALVIGVGLLVCCVWSSGNASRDTVLEPVLGSGLAACGVALGCFGVLGALYSDWVLAAIAENMVGVPSGDNAPLYWTCFVAKRLPFVSA